MKQLSTLLIAVFLFTAITPTKAQVNTQDSLALVDLYNSTDGVHWQNNNNSNWLKGSVNTWQGVTLNDSGRVIKLNMSSFVNLYSNNLNDTIPSSIGNLTDLQYLDLSYNSLYGHIPFSIGNLTNLQYLSFDSNNLTDTIPSSFSNLVNLAHLDLNFNKLTGAVPELIGNLTNLTELDLGANQFYGPFPKSFKNLLNIETIYMQFCIVDSFPAYFGNFSKLKFLDLSGNLLYGSIPSSLGNLNNLQTLRLNYNKLSGSIPASISNLSNLTSLALFNNYFTFAGMEGIVNLAPGYLDDSPEDPNNQYAPQATLPLYNNNHILSVSVGGTPSNDTFKWYRDSVLVAKKVGDSTYTITGNGTYYVVATNAVATQLTLNSDTITITSLPIKSINLQAKETNGQVLLQWQTINEINTASFTIQHSTDGKTFSDIGSKVAVGSGNNGYSFSNLAPLNGVAYYRIKAIDKDGSFSYSNVASVQFTVNSNQLTVYPNPSRDNVTISGSHIASVQVIDNSGRIVKVVSLKDATNPTIKTNDLAAGIYYLHIKTTDGGERVVSFEKQ